jgi:hypothetical protein
MPSVSNLTLDLLIENHGDSYRARVLNSPAGQASSTFAPPFQPAELDAFLSRVARRAPMTGTGSKPEELLKQVGGKLFDAVFRDEVLVSYRRSRDAADRESKGLRIRLRLNDVPELADLPWEYLYDTSRQSFLALSKETPIVRFLELPEPVEPLIAPSPLNLLAVLSSPSDYDALDVEGEWARMLDATQALRAENRITLERLPSPTLDALREQLRRKDYHILHFIGHGEFDAATQEGALVFQNADGTGRAVRDELIATLLHDSDSLRVVVLNACEGARVSAHNPFTGVAPHLIRKGIPAVIAMQFPISDPAAIQFSTDVYRTLADGYPIDAAVNEARRAIYFGGSVLEWGTPALFMRADDGTIFVKEEAMAEDTRNEPKSRGGINIGGSANVSVGRDLIGGDKHVEGDDVSAGGDVNIVRIGAGSQVGQVAAGKNITQTSQQGASGQDLVALFNAINQKVDARPEDPNVDKGEIKDTLKQIVDEAKKGDAANSVKIERWLKQLKDIAPDILEVAAAALLNPVAGVAVAVMKVAERVRAS